MEQDGYGFFGPDYSFAENIPLPGQVGVQRGSSISSIINAVGGLNFYMDTIAFGGRTMFNKQDTRPMGIRYYLNTGQRCSNGATMSVYVDGVTKGDLLGSSVKKGLASAGLPGLKGLAPGMLEGARDALDPRPIISAVSGTGYPVCQQVQCPVGDVFGSIANRAEPEKGNYIVDPVQMINGQPTQTRWVQAYNPDGWPITITQDEFGNTPKCYNADGTYMDPPGDGCPRSASAPTNLPGSGKFNLCRVVQPRTLPPTLEGFGNQEIVTVGIVALAALLFMCMK
jgi:hypothetical protein